MTRIERNKQFLTDLFNGPFRGHAIIFNSTPVPGPETPDGTGFALSTLPVSRWLPQTVESYRSCVARLDVLDHDEVPCVRLGSNTGVFAAAFGCQFARVEGSAPFTLHVVESAEEADRLPEPHWRNSRCLVRFFELATLVRRELGADAPIAVPDIQSPFDIAALVWKKEDLFMAILENPDAVKRLVAKCQRLLTGFLQEFLHEFSNVNLCHCPNTWAPSRLGCSLSEDEVGSLSVEMFEEFCLPSLVEMSREFGGLFMHCCANADHQYASFKKIPNLRGLNRVFQYPPGPRPAFEMFSGQTVFMQAWKPEETIYHYLDLALPTSRFLFNLDPMPLDEAKRSLERLRTRCPRIGKEA